jgi:hypothetical protein
LQDENAFTTELTIAFIPARMVITAVGDDIDINVLLIFKFQQEYII